MKNRDQLDYSALAFLAVPAALIAPLLFSATAPAYDRIGNGGDICEDRFVTVRDDIRSWINQNGPAGLRFPTGITLDQYKTQMLTEIAAAQVSCMNAPVAIDGAEKTCENFEDASGHPQIICNRQAFLETSESDQYVLVHHEYAGLAGFETNHGASSQYPLSNQITGFLQDQVVKKLVVGPTNKDSINPFKSFPAVQAVGVIKYECQDCSGLQLYPYAVDKKMGAPLEVGAPLGCELQGNLSDAEFNELLQHQTGSMDDLNWKLAASNLGESTYSTNMRFDVMKGSGVELDQTTVNPECDKGHWNRPDDYCVTDGETPIPSDCQYTCEKTSYHLTRTIEATISQESPAPLTLTCEMEVSDPTIKSISSAAIERLVSQ